MNHKRICSILIGAALAALAAPLWAAAPDSITIKQGFHANWADDPAYIEALSQDRNSRYAANKRLVLNFEAALERAQGVSETAPGNFKQVVSTTPLSHPVETVFSIFSRQYKRAASACRTLRSWSWRRATSLC